jgi:hypothetical protein
MKLLKQESVGHRVQQTFLHTDDSGNDVFTVATKEDVAPAFKKARYLAETQSKSAKFKASIPLTVIDEVCRINAQIWGIRPHQVYREIFTEKTDRGQKLLAMLCGDGDFKKLQGK